MHTTPQIAVSPVVAVGDFFCKIKAENKKVTNAPLSWTEQNELHQSSELGYATSEHVYYVTTGQKLRCAPLCV